MIFTNVLVEISVIILFDVVLDNSLVSKCHSQIIHTFVNSLHSLTELIVIDDVFLVFSKSFPKLIKPFAALNDIVRIELLILRLANQHRYELRPICAEMIVNVRQIVEMLGKVIWTKEFQHKSFLQELLLRFNKQINCHDHTCRIIKTGLLFC